MLKWILIGVVVLVALLAAALLAVPLLVDTPAIQAYVSQAAAHALGRPVKFASLSVSALPLPGVRLRGLQVAEDPAFGTAPFLTVGEGRMGIRLGALLRGRVELADLTLDQPRIRVVEDVAGRLNISSLGGAGGSGTVSPGHGAASRPGAAAAGAVLLSRVRIVNGTVTYQRAGAGASQFSLEKINVTVSQVALGDVLRLRGEALGQPGGVQLSLSEGTVSLAGGRSFADAPVSASVDLEARDVGVLAAVFVPSPAVAGPLKAKLRVSGTAARLTANGALTFDRLTLSEQQPHCPEPKRRALVLDGVQMPLIYAPGQVESQPVQAKVAKGTVSLRLTVALQPAPLAILRDIDVKGVQMGPILVDYYCQRNAVTGPLDLTGEARARPANVSRTLNGSGRLRMGPGKVVGSDLLNLVNQVAGLVDVVSSALRPEGRIAPKGGQPLDFDSITATYTVMDGVVRTDDLLYQSRDLKVAGAGTYALADGRLAMDVTLTQGSNRMRAQISGLPGALRVVPTEVKLQDSKDLRKFLDRLLR